MKHIKTLLICIALACSTTVFAANNYHAHKLPSDAKARASMQKKILSPGYCQIEVINSSSGPVHVTGRFVDGDYLEPFDIFPNDYPHYIVLEYYGCQPGMFLTISDFDGWVIYNNYTPVYQTVVIYDIYGKTKPTVKVQPKAH